MKQKDIFLESEGDAWLSRNERALVSRQLPKSDPLLLEITNLDPPPEEGMKLLEIGCGDASRLSWLQENCGISCYGLDPSSRAVEVATQRGVDARQGTADQLPFDDQMFDLVVFGFCLYLCDREDLFRIACEADRVLADPGWLIILDFYSPRHVKGRYHHCPGVFSYKMDYRSLFMWHPAYHTVLHRVRHHLEDRYTDDPEEWVATSVLRKKISQSE